MRPSDFAGAVPVFHVAGIQVYVHWSWFIAAGVLVQFRADTMGQSGMAALVDIIALFGIVLLHEFGHALACRSVGGRADSIVLWPLGGVAFVQPPPRPGPVLWSIAAGPLVNVVLLPITIGLMIFLKVPDPLGEGFVYEQLSRPQQLAFTIASINLTLLIFNMLPVYPLDGGQILQSLLWFIFGWARSLRIAAAVGLVLAIALLLVALRFGKLMLAVMAIFLAWQSYRGLRIASARLAQAELLPPPYDDPRSSAP